MPPIEQTEVARILDHSATALFLARAGELGTDVASNPGYPTMIAAICRQLDGIPFAIEFAAACAVALGIETVARGLQDRFRIIDKRAAYRSAQMSDSARDTRLELSTSERGGA